MKNLDFLKSCGFLEKNGWICNPKIENEAILKIDEVNDKEMKYILDVISATAFNAGCRYAEKEIKKNELIELENKIKKIKKELKIK